MYISDIFNFRIKAKVVKLDLQPFYKSFHVNREFELLTVSRLGLAYISVVPKSLAIIIDVDRPGFHFLHDILTSWNFLWVNDIFLLP